MEMEINGHSSPWTPRTLRKAERPPLTSREEDVIQLGTPRRPSRMRGEREGLPGFATPPRVTPMARQRELLEFRTPQHPAMGSNNWGGASPLLARDIPKESLETRYLRLNTLRTRDEIFAVLHGDLPPVAALPAKSGRGGAGWLFSKLKWKGRRAEVIMGAEQKKRSSWWPSFDHRGRWPQGWC